MNAISPIAPPSDTDLRRARQLRQCERLAELGMALAENAAAQALATPPSEPDDPTDAHTPRPDPALTFTRLARCVRASIALENRILDGTAGKIPASEPHPDADQHPDPQTTRRYTAFRCHLLTEAVTRATEDHPDRWNLYDDIAPALDELLADAPLDAPLRPLFEQACQAIGIPPGPHGLTPYLLSVIYPDHPDALAQEPISTA